MSDKSVARGQLDALCEGLKVVVIAVGHLTIILLSTLRVDCLV